MTTIVTMAQAMYLISTRTLTSPITIADSAANIYAGLDTLSPSVQAHLIAAIEFTSPATFIPQFTWHEYSADAPAFKLMEAKNAVLVSVAYVPITDIWHAADDAHISTFSIAVDNVKDILNFGTALTSVGPARISSVTIRDSLANITQSLDRLQALAKIGLLTSVTLSNMGTQTLPLTALAVGADIDVLLRIVSNLTIVVSDSAANVSSNLDAIQKIAGSGHLGLIILTGSRTPVLTLAAGQITADAGALARIAGHYQFSVTDIAANVSLSLGALQAAAKAGTLSAIALTDPGTPAIKLSVAQLAADAGALAKITGPYQLAVYDTAADVVASLDTLQADVRAGRLASITLTDPGAPSLTLTVAQLSGDSGALAKITGGYQIALTDTAANVAASLDALETAVLTGRLASISLTDSGTPALTLTVAQLFGDSVALAKITGGYQIALTDTAADVAASLDALQADVQAGRLASITLTDTGTPSLMLTVAQLFGDSGALAKIAGGYQVALTDTAANVAASLDALETAVLTGRLASISLTDSGTPVLLLTVTQLFGDRGALAKITGGYQIALTDTASNVAASLDALEAAAIAATFASITLTDPGTPVLTVSVAQISDDSAALARITGPYQLSVNDTAAAASASLDELEAAARSGSLAAITLTDPGVATLALSVAQLAADGDALAKIGGAYQIAVNDTGVDVGAALDTLETLLQAGGLAAITLTDSGTSDLVLTVAQLTRDSGALAKITGPYQVAVTDSAADVSASLDVLEAAALSGSLNAITLTDSGTLVLSLVAAQLTADSGALAKITGPYQVAVTDSAADVSASLDVLEAAALSGSLNAITLTDSGTLVLSLAAAQLTADSAALAKITGPYQVAVTDSAADVSASLDVLEAAALSGSLNAITLTDSGTPVLSLAAAQLTADSAALAKITGPYQVAVIDSAADVSASLDTLEAVALSGSLAAITLTDPGTPVITITSAQFSADGDALAKITGSYTISLTDGGGSPMAARLEHLVAGMAGFGAQTGPIGPVGHAGDQSHQLGVLAHTPR